MIQAAKNDKRPAAKDLYARLHMQKTKLVSFLDLRKRMYDMMEQRN